MKKVKNKKSNKTFIVLLALIIIAFFWAFIFDLNISPSARFLSLVGKTTPTPAPPPTVESLSLQVIPQEGYRANINWGDTGKKLIEAGAIDLEKFRQNYTDPKYESLLVFLTETKNEAIVINQENAYFWVNVLWALGLVQKSDVLEKGIMGTQYKDQLGNFASTGGWTLGKKDAVALYSSAEIIPLTSEQQELVNKISQGIYRPCCGNPTSFPDCNHGMAILGLVELMVSQRFSEEEIYKAALMFNSYWFPQTYIDLAYYFKTEEGTDWENVDAKKALSLEFSSSQGYQNIKKQIGNIPGSPQIGGSCGA